MNDYFYSIGMLLTEAWHDSYFPAADIWWIANEENQ